MTDDGVTVVVAYKPSHSMVGKKTQSRYNYYYCYYIADKLSRHKNVVTVVVAYKPSHSMVGKKTESRYEPEPCCPTCYLTELVCLQSSLSAYYSR